MYPFGVKRPLGVKEATLEQVIVAEEDCMLQFLKKLRINTDLFLRNSILSKPIKVYLRSSLLSSSNEVLFTAGTSH